MFEAFLVFLQYFRVVVQLPYGLNQKGVEVEGVVAAQFGFVGGVEVCHLAAARIVAGLARKLQRVEHGVFGLADLGY